MRNIQAGSLFGAVTILVLLQGAGEVRAQGWEPVAPRARFSAPVECDAPVLKREAVTCGWNAEVAHTFVVTLEELHGDLRASCIGPEQISRIPAKPRREDGFAIESDFVESVIGGMIERETLTRLSIKRLLERERPPGAIDCVRFTMEAEDRQVPSAPGKLFIQRDIGVICNSYDRESATIRVVVLDVSERFSGALGHRARPDFASLADKMLASLRLE